VTSYFVKPTNPTAARTFERTALVRVEAVHALSPSAKEATALEGLKARLDAVKTETGAEIKAAAIDGRSGSRVDQMESPSANAMAQARQCWQNPRHWRSFTV